MKLTITRTEIKRGVIVRDVVIEKHDFDGKRFVCFSFWFFFVKLK